MTVDHLRLATSAASARSTSRRSRSSGDVTLEEASARAKGFKVGLIRVEKYFEGTNITAYAGPPPEPENTDYCWGGCPGAIEEAIEILRLFDAQCDRRCRVCTWCSAPTRAPSTQSPARRWSSSATARPGRARSTTSWCRSAQHLQGPRDQGPVHAKHDDIFAKMLSVSSKLAQSKSSSHVRFEGCPVSVAEQVLALVTLGKTKNPYLSASEAMRFNLGYMGWRGMTLAQRAVGKKYQVHGDAQRGHAKPEVDEPAHPGRHHHHHGHKPR
jgi:hypothetical protein